MISLRDGVLYYIPSSMYVSRMLNRMIQITARLVQKNYTSPDCRYHVFLMAENDKPVIKAVYYGKTPPVCLPEASYLFSGKWFDHPRYGKQFKIHRYRLTSDVNTTHDTSIKKICEMLSH